MLAILTLEGLTVWRHGTCSPLWRRLVTLDNFALLNGIAAVIVATCFAYSVKRLFFVLNPLDDPKDSTKNARLTPYLTFIPFFIIPAYVDRITGMSPFFFSLVPSALAVAFLASLNQSIPPPSDDEQEDVPLPKYMWLRVVLSGACASVGVWEGSVGVIAVFAVLPLLFIPCVNRDRSIPSLLLLWMLGFGVAFLAEGMSLGWPWAAFRPSTFPILGTFFFIMAAVVPVVFVRALGETFWLLIAWGAVLAFLTTNVIVDGRYGRKSGCERFAKKVLRELGERKLIVGDGFTDDFFREFKPSDVRLVGCRSVEEREFLIAFFDQKEPMTNRALVVRHYHHLPEMADAAAELGLLSVGTEVTRQPAVTNETDRLAKFAKPIARSIREMTEEYGKIPVSERKAKINEARANIRRGWANGLRGDGMSATILALDILLGDRDGAESDALIALTANREDPAANAVLGNLRLQKGQFDKAERYLRKGVLGGGSGACNDLAMLLVKTGRAAEAEAWARKAVGSEPDNWNIHETLVKVLIELGRKDEAQKELVEAERLAKKQNQYERARETINLDRERIFPLCK